MAVFIAFFSSPLFGGLTAYRLHRIDLNIHSQYNKTMGW